MATASLSEPAQGRVELSGELDFSSVPKIWPQLQRLIQQEPQLELSLAEVSSSNSAALALLLEAVQAAGSVNKSLVLQDLPADLMDLAVLSNLDDILGVSSPRR